MSRFISKLAAASGGWERFLYETLKDVVDKVGQYGFTGEGENAVEDAQEILEAYHDCHTRELQLDKVKSTKALEVDKKVSIKAPVKATSKPTVDMRPKKAACQIYVDEEVGGSNGSLPIPIGRILTNRNQLKITSMDGSVHFANSEADGQIKSSRVSGHISGDGKYRLVFQKVDIGKALIHYEHVPGPAPVKAPPAAPVPVGGYTQPVPIVQQVNPEMNALEERITTESQEL